SRDNLYLRIPLRGDFEVTGELTTFGWHRADLGYNCTHIELKQDRRNYDLLNLSRRLSGGKIEPELPDLGEWYTYRLVVKDGQWAAYVGGRKVCEELLPPDPDPWLFIHAPRPHTTGTRNVRISGSPTVPEVLRLSDALDLSGWYSYQGLAVTSENGAWQK